MAELDVNTDMVNRRCFSPTLLLLVLVQLCQDSKQSPPGQKGTGQLSCNRLTLSVPRNVSDGASLMDLTQFIYSGTPASYGILSYKYNSRSCHISSGGGFKCSARGFSDERRYVCLHDSGSLRVRRNSGFQLIPGGTIIQVVIQAFSEGGRKLDTCVFSFKIGVKPTRSSPSTTVANSTPTEETATTGATATAAATATTAASEPVTSKPAETEPTTAATAKTTTSASTTSTTVTVKSTMASRRTTLERNPETSEITTRITSATIPVARTLKKSTPKPCVQAKMLHKKLRTCRKNVVELHAVSANQSTQSGFEFNLDKQISSPIWKMAYVKVRSHADFLKPNESVLIEIVHKDGLNNPILKKLEAMVEGGKVEISIDKFIPNGMANITVQLAKDSQPLQLPVGLVSLVVNLYDFCLNQTCLDHYYDWKNNFSTGKCAGTFEDDPLAQFGTCFAVCSSEITTSSSSNKSIVWPMAFPDSSVTKPCFSGAGNVSRTCKKFGNEVPRWEPIDPKACKTIEEKRSEALDALLKASIDARNASEAAEKLKTITENNPLTILAQELDSVTRILEGLSNFATDEKIANNMLDAVDNCLLASEESLRQSQRANNVSKRMVTLLSTVGEALLKNKTEFIMSKKGFAVAGTKASKTSFQGVLISYKSSVRGNSTSKLSIKKGPNAVREQDSSSSIQLPRTLLSSQGRDLNDLIFIAYDHGKLFQENGQTRLNSKIISADVRNAQISGLTQPVVTKFKAKNFTESVEHVCAWWDFNLYGGSGGWSTSNCSLFKATTDGYAECHCNHLTNFAVLLGAKTPKEDTAHQLALTLISYIGVGISLAGTFFTLISYIIFPKLRDNAPPKILMNLCAALIFLQAVFLIGIERTSPRQGCQAVAFLLQYVLLCVLSWSGVEGFFSYRGIVMPMKSEVQNLMFKASMFGWVVPILFPIIGIAVWTEDYGDSRSCAVKGMPLYTTVIAPVALVMLLNAFSIVSIMAALHKSSKLYPHNAINAVHRLRIIAAFVLLFSLSWMFGFLVVANDIIAFQYVFCILNSLQGFFLFVFYGVRNENVRKSWLDKFRNYRERRALSTSAATKKTDSSFDSVTYNKTDSLRSNSLRKSKDMDNKFQVHLTARANVYAEAPTV